MSETFTNKLTIKGQQKKALAEANNTPLNITTFKVGDGNGTYYEPNENQTALKNTKYTGTFSAGTQSQIVINPSASNEVLYKCFIPADVGGFTIRELGLFDDDGDLILICKLPAQDKFALASGLYQPLTFTPKIIYTNPQTQAVLTPTSQVVPTTSEVINLITENVPETICTLPMKNTNGTISLEFDTTLKLLSNKLSVELSNIIKTDGTNKATSLLGYAAVVSASADLDIPSFKNVKDYVTGLNYLKKDGTVTATALLSYASAVSASADTHIPSYKNVKDYITGLNYLKKDGTVTATSLLSYASSVTASADLSIPSYKNVKDYIAGLNYLKKDGTVTATSLLSYSAVVSASADLDIPSYKNVKDYVTNSLPNLSTKCCPNSGNLNNGEADLLSCTGTTVSFKVGGSYSNLTLTYADKSQEVLTSLTSITDIRTKVSNSLPILTANSSNGITLTATTEAEPAWNSADNSVTTRYRSSTATGFLKFHKNTGTFGKILGYAITGNYEPALLLRSPKSWVLKDASGNIIDTRTNEIGWTTSQRRVYMLPTPVDTNEFFLDSIVNNGTDYLTVNEVEILVENASGTVLLDGGYTILKEAGSNPISVISTKISQGKTFPTAPIDRCYHCLTAMGLKTYKYVGGAWVETQYVILGTVTVANSIITAVTTSPFNQNGYDVTTQTALALGNNLAKSIPNLSMPNYANGISKSWNISYQAESDGYVYVQADFGSTFYVSYNNSTWTSFSVSRFDGQGFGNGTLMPISKGIYYKAAYATARALSLVFYPCLGA